MLIRTGDELRKALGHHADAYFLGMSSADLAARRASDSMRLKDSYCDSVRTLEPHLETILLSAISMCIKLLGPRKKTKNLFSHC